MAVPILIPDLGSSVEDYLLIEWRAQAGDSVECDDILCELETGKAIYELKAPESGILLDIFLQEGENAEALTTIAVIGQEGESYEELKPESLTKQETETSPAITETPHSDEPAAQHTTEDSSGNTSISPRARRLAEQLGVPVQGIRGTGPGGRIIERDIPGRQTEISGPAAQPELPQEGVEIIPVQGIRKIVAREMMKSIHSTAQLTLHTSAQASVLLSLYENLKTASAVKITLNDLILFAVSRTLSKHPKLNSHFLGDKILQFAYVQLAFAVDTPQGLIVPVMKNAHLLDLETMSRESKRLITACREGVIQPDDLTGSTFTVTNLGSMGIEYFTPVLNLPQVAILGVNAIQQRAVANGEGYQPHLGLSLTIDHQAVDGADGARFLQDLSQMIARLDQVIS
jgi:pyruvate dehydrogenase E2 component (dihydrolipoamide acetyltransferase)